MTKKELRQQWDELTALNDAPLKERQQRGYQLEKLITDFVGP
ncbi:hypothetical protein [Desulfonema ishimotonii]|nr:hypothetical protein [Desulfonema ishimotonii]